jgi:hypothetical protein
MHASAVIAKGFDEACVNCVCHILIKPRSVSVA